jgi:RNA polymerase sigma-70 factor (ECF subfamily)
MDDPMPAALTESRSATDAALAARLACGYAEALDPLYRRHRGLVYRFALLWSGSAAIAADVAQDVFLHLLTRAGDFDPARAPLPSWLLGIARNFVRRRTGVPTVDPLDDHAASMLISPAPQPESELEAKRELDRLRAAITALPPHYRDVLVLVELAERSYAEVAAICGCELNTVRSRLSRARALLAQWLDVDRSERPVFLPDRR